MSWVRRAFSIALFVATFGTMATAILGVIDPLFMLIAWAALLSDSLLAINRHHRRLNRPAPAGPVRPDADVAQYLNDSDRAWLMEHGDWTDPATRIVERPSSASDTLAADRKRRAEKVVSQMDSADGWRTTRYADGRTVEHAVTDETVGFGPTSEAAQRALAGAERARKSAADVQEWQQALADMDRMATAAVEAARIDRALAGLNYARKYGPVPGMAAGGAVRAEPSDIDGHYRPIGMVGADEGLDHRSLIDPDWRK